MSTFDVVGSAERERHIDGAIIVLGALLREEHPAVAAAHIARLLSEARIPADLCLIGQVGDEAVFDDTIGDRLERHDGMVHVGSRCYATVQEAT